MDIDFKSYCLAEQCSICFKRDPNCATSRFCKCTDPIGICHERCLKEKRVHSDKAKHFFCCDYCKAYYDDTEAYVKATKHEIDKEIQPGEAFYSCILMFYITLILVTACIGKMVIQDKGYDGEDAQRLVGLCMALTLCTFGFSFIVYLAIRHIIKIFKISIILIPLLVIFFLVTEPFVQWNFVLNKHVQILAIALCGISGNIALAVFMWRSYKKHIESKTWKKLKSIYLEKHWV